MIKKNKWWITLSKITMAIWHYLDGVTYEPKDLCGLEVLGDERAD
jgi:hypothetical protein